MPTNEHQINSREGLTRIHPNFFVAQSTTYDNTFGKIDVFIFMFNDGCKMDSSHISWSCNV